MEDLAIRADGLLKSYPGFSLGPLSFDVPRGGVLGLVGPNGAGKSTLLRVLMGLVRQDAGELHVLGLAMPRDERRVKALTGFVSEDMALYPSESLAWHASLVRRAFGAWDDAWASSWLRRLRLDPDRPVGGFSRGQQVKAMLVLALARHPRVLVLDEPTTGLDPVARREIVELLADTRDGRDATIFSSHQSDDVASLAREVLFIDGGRVLARGPVDAFVAEGRSLEAAFLARLDAAAREEVA